MKPITGKRSGRRTRPQVFPDWSMHELLLLVNEVAAVETEIDYLFTMSSYQKWKLISDNCVSLGVSRSLNQCRKKWEHLLHEYKVIKEWEFHSRISYCSLDKETVSKAGLPLSFDKDLFVFIEDNVSAPAPAAAADTDSDPDFKYRGSSGYKRQRRCQLPQNSSKIEVPPKVIVDDEADEKKHREQEEMAVKLREQGDLIHAILKGDGVEVQIEKRRWQGSELIKVFGGLVSNIEQLLHVVQKGR